MRAGIRWRSRKVRRGDTQDEIMRVVGVPRVRRVESCVCVCGVCGGRCYAGESREALCETACRCAPVWAVATLRLRGG